MKEEELRNTTVYNDVLKALELTENIPIFVRNRPHNPILT